MYRYEIINKFIEKYNLTSYLEIGTRHRENFDKIVCKEKICVDPYPPEGVSVDFKMTSDEFFKVCGKQFDCVFIDGLHEAHQVYRDILNSLKLLKKGGVIICHDCMPSSSVAQKEFESYNGIEDWNGDGWKAFAKYRFSSTYYCYTITEDCGCGIIDTNKESDIGDENKMSLNINELCWEAFDKFYTIMINPKPDIVE
ncbi:MAG: class I SAM-dependent methyltransferase [Paludibacteraceae bacterium]|nr:class I SAM-dependent methyltransferase [Paludibacteraceae bacterium]